MSRPSLADVAETAVVEGCVGETLAAIQATEQLAVTIDAEVTKALRRIARDEARHAELAWTFVRWACDVGGAEVRDRVRRVFSQSLQTQPQPTIPGAADGAAAWHEHGRLSRSELSAIRRLAKREVIAPAVELLLGATSSANARA